MMSNESLNLKVDRHYLLVRPQSAQCSCPDMMAPRSFPQWRVDTDHPKGYLKGNLLEISPAQNLRMIAEHLGYQGTLDGPTMLTSLTGDLRDGMQALFEQITAVRA